MMFDPQKEVKTAIGTRKGTVFFGCNLTQIPGFRACRDNYEVAQVIALEDIIPDGCHPEPENGTYFVTFDSIEVGRIFIERLNAYIERNT